MKSNQFAAMCVLVSVVASLLIVSGGVTQDAKAGNPNPPLTLRIPVTQTYTDFNFPTANYCNNATSSLVRGTASKANTAVIWVNVPTGTIPANANIVSASINEFYTATVITKSSAASNTAPFQGQLDLVAVKSAWSLCTITWNTQPLLVQYIGAAQVISNLTASFQQPMSADFTSALQSWLNGTLQNNGIAFMFDSSFACNLATCGTGYAYTTSHTNAVSVPFVTVQYTVGSAAVFFSPYCSGGPCELNVFSGSGLAPWLFNWSWSGNGNSTVGLPTGNSAVPSTNLKLAYNMDTLNGSKMKDFSGLVVPNDGTLTSVGFGAGKYGLAGTFNGVSSKVTAADAASISPTSAITISFWFKNATWGVAGNRLVNKLVGSPLRGYNVDETGGVLRMEAFNAGTDDQLSATLPAAGNWVHVAAVWAPGTNGQKLYFNGVLAAQRTPTNPSIAYGAGGLEIGDWAGGGFATGSIDQVEVFNAAMSAAQILNLATAAPYQRSPTAGFNANLSQPATLRAMDFFGNELYNTTQTITSNPYFWNVPIPYRLLKVDNARDAITNVAIAPAGSTNPMAFSLMPREIWSAPVKSGVVYYLNFTLLNLNFQTISTLSILRTFSTSVSYIVNGTATIDSISVSLSGTTTNLNKLWGTANLTQSYLIQQWAKVNSTQTNVRFVWSAANNTWLAVNLTNGHVVGVWNRGNDTFGLVGGVGNAVLAPRGLDFFKPFLFGVPSWRIVGGLALGVNLWTVLLASEIVGGIAFMWSTRDLKWFKDVKRALQRKPLAATILIVLGFFLFLAAVLAITTGSFIVPFPVTIP